MINILGSRTVAELVTDNYKAADVFKKHNIDFCCGGGISVEEVCKKKNLDYKSLESELLALDEQVDAAHDYANWPMRKLVDYIMDKHHAYVKESIPVLFQYAGKVTRVHGDRHPDTVLIKDLFIELAEELVPHMGKEERILFPYIKQMEGMYDVFQPMPTPPFGSVENPIRMMELEHDNAGSISKKIAELSNNFQPPEGACNTFRVLYLKLGEFVDDLHQHIHLENNILFPRAIELAKAKENTEN